MPMTAKPPCDSYVEKTEIVLPSDANNLGSVFGGRVMAWIDITAAISALRHARCTMVTASMDDLHFLAPVKQGHIAVLKGIVAYVGRTSLEVAVTVESEDPRTGERVLCCRAFLTFVALGDDQRPTAVPPLKPQTDVERQRMKEAGERRTLRLERKRKFDKLTPIENAGPS